MQQNYDEIEIDLRDVIRAIFSRWWLILFVYWSLQSPLCYNKICYYPVYKAETSFIWGRNRGSVA